jgi:hypothetical protein
MIDPDSALHRLAPTAMQLAAYAEHRLRGAELQFVELWLVRHPVVLDDVLHARFAWKATSALSSASHRSLRTRQFQRESASLVARSAAHSWIILNSECNRYSLFIPDFINTFTSCAFGVEAVEGWIWASRDRAYFATICRAFPDLTRPRREQERFGSSAAKDQAMWDIGWRSIAVGGVFLLDLVVFGDLVRGEFSDVRARWMAMNRGRVPAVGDGGATAASPKGVCIWPT